MIDPTNPRPSTSQTVSIDELLHNAAQTPCMSTQLPIDWDPEYFDIVDSEQQIPLEVITPTIGDLPLVLGSHQ